MSAVISLGDFRNKGTVTLLRELLGRALRGQIAGLAFNVEFKDGTRKAGVTGKYQADQAAALRVAERLNQRAADASTDVGESGLPDDPTGVVVKLKR